ncbi:MAG: OmpH family outer membrane protein, partial [Bacteroidetes bacterium]
MKKKLLILLFCGLLISCADNPSSQNSTTNISEKTETTSQIIHDTVYIKEPVPCKELKILYVNTDKLWEEFKMVKDYEKIMEKEKSKLENQYNTELKKLETEYATLEKIASSMTQEEIQTKQQEMLQKQQNLIVLERDLTEKYNQFESEKTKEIQDFIHDFLQHFARTKKCDYILNYGTLSPVLYAPKELDVTSEV